MRPWELEPGLSAGVEPELASARELVLEMRLVVASWLTSHLEKTVELELVVALGRHLEFQPLRQGPLRRLVGLQQLLEAF